MKDVFKVGYEVKLAAAFLIGALAIAAFLLVPKVEKLGFTGRDSMHFEPDLWYLSLQQPDGMRMNYSFKTQAECETIRADMRSKIVSEKLTLSSCEVGRALNSDRSPSTRN